jgi:GT2 family glycosyltransferase
MKVAAVVVSHLHPTEVEESLPALASQVDELVVIANIPGSVADGVEAVHNARPLGFAANINQGVRLTTAELVLTSNPDAVPEPDAVAILRRFMESIRAAASRDWMVSSRTGGGSRHGGASHGHRERSCAHAAAPRRAAAAPLPPRRVAADSPVEADWMLGGFLLLRREMLDEIGGFDEGFRLYGEDIDLQYRAMRAGWERWYVPAAVVRHEHKAETDKRWLTRRTLWHWAGIARFVRKHPERLKAL